MSRLKLLLLAAFLGFAPPALALSSNVNGLTASGAIVGTQLFYCPIGASTDLKCSAAQIAAYNYSLMNGDCTASGIGAITCTKTNGVSYGPLATAALTNTRAGDIVYWNGSAWAILPGNNVQNPGFLQETNLGVPSWVAGTASGVSSFSTTCPVAGPSTGAVTLTNGANPIAYSASHTMLAAECGSNIEASGASTTITALSTITAGYQFTVSNQNASGGANVTVAPGGSNTFNGSAGNITLTPGQSIGVAAGSSATNWDVFGLSSPVGASITGPGYNTSNIFLDRDISSVGAAASAPALLTAYCIPTWINNINPLGGGTGTLGTLYFDVTTLAAGGNVQVALYSNGTNNRPNALLGATANISTAATGWITATISASVSQGQYWFCTQSDNTTVRWEQNSVTVSMNNVGYASPTNITTNIARGISTTTGISAFGTWPSFAAASWTQINFPPIIQFQFTSIP